MDFSGTEQIRDQVEQELLSPRGTKGQGEPGGRGSRSLEPRRGCEGRGRGPVGRPPPLVAQQVGRSGGVGLLCPEPD